MKRLATVVGVFLLFAFPDWARAEELQGASLAGLSRLAAVIVTVDNDTVAEGDVRSAVERRLTRAHIIVDDAPGPELLVSVSVRRDTAGKRRCAYRAFRVRVSLREPVMLERAPDRGSVAAITWAEEGSLSGFGWSTPRLRIMDIIEEGMGSFLRAVASDTQQAEREQARP